MVGHVVVRDRDGGGPVDGIYQPVPAVGERAVVDPDVLAVEDRDAVAVRHPPPPVVPRRVPYHGVRPGLAVVDVDAVDDDVGDVVDGDARAASNMDAGAPAVDRLVRVHHELLLQLDDHVSFEDDPQWLVLYYRMAEGARPRVHGVVVPRVADHVDPAMLAPDGAPPEPDGAVG